MLNPSPSMKEVYKGKSRPATQTWVEAAESSVSWWGAVDVVWVLARDGVHVLLPPHVSQEPGGQYHMDLP